MARLGLATVGAIAGAIIFPGSAFAISAGFFIGSTIGGILFPEQLPTVFGPRLSELGVNASTYGRPIPIIYHRMVLPANIIWSPGLVEHKKKKSVGGKGGPEQSVVTFTYTASFEAMFCEGPAVAILRLWFNAKLVYDATEFNTGPVSQFLDNIRFFLGTETQLPDPETEIDKGTGNVPADRGIVKIHVQDLPLEDFGNAIPTVRAEVAITTGPVFPTADLALDGTSLELRHSFGPPRGGG